MNPINKFKPPPPGGRKGSWQPFRHSAPRPPTQAAKTSRNDGVAATYVAAAGNTPKRADAARTAAPSFRSPALIAFPVDLDVFRGPLDLLLYLVRKHEVEITEIPIAEVTDQYLVYLEGLRHLDVDAVGDFLEVASTLAEIKSRMVLPRADEIDDPFDDPRDELVRQLLEYKKFKDAASMLEERGRSWQERYARQSVDLPVRRCDPGEQPIQEVELWDLVSAFGRVMREISLSAPSSVIYDETPIHVFMKRIHERVHGVGRLAFRDLFTDECHKSTHIGNFLAVLELVRHHHVHVDQNELFGEIWLVPTEESAADVDFSHADSYEHGVAVDEDTIDGDAIDEDAIDEDGHGDEVFDGGADGGTDDDGRDTPPEATGKPR